jgi:hypothetical protein
MDATTDSILLRAASPGTRAFSQSVRLAMQKSRMRSRTVRSEAAGGFGRALWHQRRGVLAGERFLQLMYRYDAISTIVATVRRSNVRRAHCLTSLRLAGQCSWQCNVQCGRRQPVAGSGLWRVSGQYDELPRQ